MKRDSVYIAHILQEMEFIEANFSDRPFEEIIGDDMMQRSLIRSIEVIGGAAKDLSGNNYSALPREEETGEGDRRTRT